MSNLQSEPKTPISSSSRKSVFLWEWWLIKVGSKLGVGGFCNRETLGSLGMRILGSASTSKKYNVNTVENGIQVYGSAAISKRLNYNTLEAVDGTIITISGSINRSRSLSNGFSHEVCDRFLSGFPFIWEDNSHKSSYEKCGDTTERFMLTSFDDLPVTRVRDILMSATGESESRFFTSIILKDIQKHFCKESLSQKESTVNFDEISRKSTETEDDHKNKDDDVSLLNPTQKIIEESHKTPAFPVDLHEEDLENYKETKDEHKQEETMSAEKRTQTSRRKRYPIRSKTMKKNRSLR